jgi:integrase
MAVRMAQLTRSPSGLWTSRKVIPADVRGAYGKREEKPTWSASLTQAQARAEYGAWLTAVEARIIFLRSADPSAPLIDLSERQTRALAGKWYAETSALFSQNPGSEEGWDAALEAVCPPDSEEAWLAHMRGDERPRHEPWRETPYLIAERDRLLARESVRLTPAASARLIQEMAGLYAAMCNLMVRRAQGDFSDDTILSVLPAWLPPAAVTTPEPKRAAKGSGILDLFDGYAAERGLAPATLKSWRQKLNHLIDFLGHDDSTRVTPEDVVRWKDHLLTKPSRDGAMLSAKTVREGYLSAAKATFKWAKSNRKVEVDPTVGISVRGKKKQRLRSPGFSDGEARMILRATLVPATSRMTPRRALALRWVPWLCAYSGARVNEMTQLRKMDVIREEGVWLMRVTPEAGGVKDGIARNVPIHVDLIEQGFVAAVEKAPDGPLFYDPKDHRGGSDGNPQYKKVGRGAGQVGQVARYFRSRGRAQSRLASSLQDRGALLRHGQQGARRHPRPRTGNRGRQIRGVEAEPPSAGNRTAPEDQPRRACAGIDRRRAA